MVTVTTERGDAPIAIALVEAMMAEIGALYGGLGTGPTATPSDLSPPHGAFVVVWEDGRPVAGGGVKRLEPGLGEIRRMYVVPEARSRGHARRLLIALEDAARALGYDRVRLDTGPQQPHARALYDSAGYVEIPDYNGNPRASFWGEKDLAGEAAPVRHTTRA